MLAVLLGCGLRRSEAAALTLRHIQQRDNRWCIVDLIGKQGRVRTIPMPTWVKVALDIWTVVAGLADGFAFRPVNRGDQVRGEFMSEKVVWQLLNNTRRLPVFQASHRMTFEGPAPSSAVRREASLSRSNCSSVTRQSRQPNDILAPSRIWSMRLTTRSD